MADACDITYFGKPTDLRVFGFITDGLYAAPIRFYDPPTATYSNLTATGLKTALSSTVVVHNTTPNAIQIMPVVRATDLTEFHATASPFTVLAPYGTSSVDLAASLQLLASSGVLLATLTLETAAAPGSIVGSLTQRDQDNIIEDIPLRTSNPPAFDRGSYPLRWVEDYTNTPMITNTSNKPLGYRAIMTAGDQIYVFPKGLLAPYATKVFDVDAIRKEGFPDVNGNRIPDDAPYGKFLWSELSDGKNDGLLGRTSLASLVNKRRSSFSCGEGCDISEDFFPVVTVDGQVTYGAFIQGSLQEQYSSGNQPKYYYPFSYSNFSWYLPDNSYISVGSDANSTSTFDVTATGVGSTSLTWDTFDYYSAYSVGAGDCETTETDGSGQASETSTPMVKLSVPSTITAGGMPSSPYQVTATAMPSGGQYTFSISSGNTVTLASTTASTNNTSNITGTATGISTIAVSYAVNGQTGTDSKPIQVLKADNLMVANDTTQTKNSPSGAFEQRIILYTMQSGSTPITDPILIREMVPNPLNDSCGQTVSTSSGGAVSSSVYPFNNNQFADGLADPPQSNQPSCSFSFPKQQWLQVSPSSVIATIGVVNVSTTSISINGSTSTLTGTDFKP